MRSIRFRLIATYVLIILLTMFLIEFGVYSLINNYYVNNISTILKSQQDICINLYQELYYNQDLYMESNAIGKKFIVHTDAQLQLLDKEGQVLYDSINQYKRGKAVKTNDVKLSLAHGLGTWQGELKSGEPIYAISQLIYLNNEPVGAIRMVTSLQSTYDVINQLMMVLIFVGLIIVIIVTFVSLFLSNTIVKPVRKLASYATSIADGHLEQQLEKSYDDELGQLTDNLNHMATQLAKTEKMKDEFIASISHELRTPLTSIKGWTVTLRTIEETDDKLYDEGFMIIEEETDRLTDLVNELLDFSKLSSHQLVIEKDSMDVIELINYVYKQMKTRAIRKGVILKIQLQDEKIVYYGDYKRLKQVIINLLDNSFKYTQENGVVGINCKLEKDCIIIKVEDTGKGIAEEDIPHIFRRYYQGQNAVEGGGLGLALVKEIVEAHGGTIDVKSEINVGTSMTISLKR